MIRRILQGIAILGAAAVLAALSMTWVVVSVFIPEDDLRLWIPAPVVLAQGVVTVIDPPELRTPIPVDGKHARVAAEALRTLETAEDGELFRLESADETIVIRLEEGRIHVEVDDPTDHIRVYAPVRQVREFLEEFGEGPVEPLQVFRLARSLPSGPLVEVDNAGTQVSVRVW